MCLIDGNILIYEIILCGICDSLVVRNHSEHFWGLK